MDNVRKKRWFSITAYVVGFLSVWSLSLFLAETYFPNQSSNLFPRQSDRNSSRRFQPPGRQNSQKADAAKVAGQEKLLLLINQKQSAGKSELIYRGLVGSSEFRIDVIILELDPKVSYPYRFKITQAKKSFRLADRYYQLISAKKGALRLRLITEKAIIK
jgi:hypothetical protein